MLSDKIRGVRIIQGMSQSQLARRSGHAVSTIHGIENGDNKNPSFKTICDIAKVLEIPLDELYQEALSKKVVNANQRP
mgnify:CR=1 FL=1|jgi:DNA-binding XRE family transcriptional regulator